MQEANKKEQWYVDKTICQKGNLSVTLNRITNNGFEGFEDGDIIYFYVAKKDEKMEALFFSNFDGFNKDEYDLIHKISLLNLKNEVICTESFKTIKEKLKC